MTSLSQPSCKVNHPRYHPRRVDRGLTYDLEVIEMRRAMFQGWEQEWAADGTLTEVGALYIPVAGDGAELAGPSTFADALLVIWDGKEPKSGHSLKAVQL